MNPLITAILTRVAVGAIGAAAAPTAINMEPTAPIPASLEDALIQVVVALIAAGALWIKQRQAKKAEK